MSDEINNKQLVVDGAKMVQEISANCWLKLN